jgi:phage FluMu protein Com
MQKRQIKKEETEFYKKCPRCSKEIKGKTEGQVEYNLNIHIQAKHKERGKINGTNKISV